MRWRDRGIALLLVFLAIAGFVVLPSFGRSHAGPAVWDGTPQFRTERAWADMVTLATRFPRRWSGSSDRNAAAKWLTATLQEIGLETHRDSLRASLGDELGRVELVNVWGISRGAERPDELVVPLGNYDMASTSFQAASDTAAHVGVLLELARQIHAAPHRRTFVFLFPDAEEWGFLGARHFARTFPQRRQIVASLSIEDVDAYELGTIGIVSIGQFHGFAPMWLRALAAAAARHEGLRAGDDPPLMEWLARSVLVPATDQGPMLDAGIPSVDLAGWSTAPAELKEAIYHKPGDTIDTMRPQSIARYGRVMERILRTIDGMPAVPRESDFYLRLDQDLRVPALPLLAIQIGVFLPLAAVVALRWRRSMPAVDVLRSEAGSLGVVFGALIAWLAAVKIMPRAGLMPLWELQPATSRHPALTAVYWIPAILSFVVLGVVWWALRRVRDASGTRQVSAAGQRITVALLFLLLVAAVTLADNPFGAVTFLMLPALLWIWIETPRTWLGRVVVTLGVLAGFLVILVLFVFYGVQQRIGAYILWYVFMGISYGQFTLLRVVLALAMTAIGIRLLQIVFSRALYPSDARGTGPQRMI